MSKWLVIFMLIFFNNAYNQIIIPGGEVESQYCNAVIAGGNDTFSCIQNCCDIPAWIECDKLVGSYHLDSAYKFTMANKHYVVSGSSAIQFRSQNPGFWGSLSSLLSCPLKVGSKYLLKIPIRNIYTKDNNGVIFVDTIKQLNIWGNADSCSRTEILWSSPYLDTAWRIYTATLKPTTQDYNFIHLRQAVGGPRYGGTAAFASYMLQFDSLSAIYPLDAGMVRAMAKDTAVGVDKCVTLRAIPQISTYDTVLWYQHTGTSLLPVGMGWSVPVCPTAHSTYIVAMRDSVPDCAGIWWSYDTVRVWIDTTIDTRIAEAPRTRLGISLYPNPAQRSIQIEMLLDRSYIRETATLTLYDMLGRAVYSTTFYNEQDIALPPLPEAMYTAEVRLDTHYWRGKLWVRE